jgi:hypothetical protein
MNKIKKNLISYKDPDIHAEERLKATMKDGTNQHYCLIDNRSVFITYSIKADDVVFHSIFKGDIYIYDRMLPDRLILSKKIPLNLYKSILIKEGERSLNWYDTFMRFKEMSETELDKLKLMYYLNGKEL